MTGPTEEVDGTGWWVELAQRSLAGGAVRKRTPVGVKDEALAALRFGSVCAVAQGKDTQGGALGPVLFADGEVQMGEDLAAAPGPPTASPPGG